MVSWSLPAVFLPCSPLTYSHSSLPQCVLLSAFRHLSRCSVLIYSSEPTSQAIVWLHQFSLGVDEDILSFHLLSSVDYPAPRRTWSLFRISCCLISILWRISKCSFLIFAHVLQRLLISFLWWLLSCCNSKTMWLKPASWSSLLALWWPP